MQLLIHKCIVVVGLLLSLTTFSYGQMAFKPISVEREDGFYAALNYTSTMSKEDIVLEDAPSLSINDILKVKKIKSRYTKSFEIGLVLTEAGAHKFYLLTKEHIGQALAIVIDKQIVSMPVVQAAIEGGKINITGNFTEEEVHKMIASLQRKN